MSSKIVSLDQIRDKFQQNYLANEIDRSYVGRKYIQNHQMEFAQTKIFQNKTKCTVLNLSNLSFSKVRFLNQKLFVDFLQ